MPWASFVHISQVTLGQAIAGDNEMKLMMKQAPEWGLNQPPTDQKEVQHTTSGLLFPPES